MNQAFRNRCALGILCVILVCLAAYFYHQRDQALQSLAAEQARSQRMDQLTSALAYSENQEVIPASKMSVFSASVEQAAKKAGLSPSKHIKQQSSAGSRGIKDSNLAINNTELLLDEVTIEQTLKMLFVLKEEFPGMRVRSIDLTAGKQEKTKEVWSIRISLALTVDEGL